MFIKFMNPLGLVPFPITMTTYTTNGTGKISDTKLFKHWALIGPKQNLLWTLQPSVVTTSFMWLFKVNRNYLKSIHFLSCTNYISGAQ